MKMFVPMYDHEARATIVQGRAVYISTHAEQRMAQRGVDIENVERGLKYGRRCHVRGARMFFVGKREAKEYGRHLEKLVGLHIVVVKDTIVTVYRNAKPSFRKA